MDDLKPEALGQALGHERSMTGLGRRLYAQQRRDPMDRESLQERLQRHEIEYLRIAVEKTAGAAEQEAWGWLMEKIRGHYAAAPRSP